MYRCNNDDWCCSPGGDIDSCCDSGNSSHLFSLLGNNYQIYNGSAWAPDFTMVPVSALANVTAVTTSTMVIATSIIKQTTVHSDAHKATKIGVGVGFGVGMPLFTALIGVWVLLIKEKRKSKLLRIDGALGRPTSARNDIICHDQGPQRQEMPAVSMATELPESFGHAELR